MPAVTVQNSITADVQLWTLSYSSKLSFFLKLKGTQETTKKKYDDSI